MSAAKTNKSYNTTVDKNIKYTERIKRGKKSTTLLLKKSGCSAEYILKTEYNDL